ncbi:MAG: DEAD/DEAH box helicase [Bryobacterales bacterium]|nr:DEAD/DEAH box helicase [Bryobacterales bacterium]MBV9396701.1 DEAD/DEAH box helicase [Bryobacterales bacterium]
MNTFSELPLCNALQTNLIKHGFIQPTPVQSEAIPPALAGRDVVATAQTGTGKTLAFLLPVIQSLAEPDGKPVPGIRALILAPTRELALQIHEAAIKLTAGLNFHSAVVVGGMNETTQLRQIRQGAQIAIATPGRLCDLLDRKLIQLGNVGPLVLDEADRMLDMGFLPALKRILKHIPESRQTLFFSATIEKSVAHLVSAYVKDATRVAVGAATKPIDQIDLHLYEVEQDRKLSLLQQLLRSEVGSFLVFARTKHGTDRLAKRLKASGIDAARIHGNRTQGQRNQALAGFKKGDYRVLVATDVAARGIHVDDIAHVVNYDLPQVAEDFIHRVGRTGRAGARGTASTFATRSERGDVRKIEAAMRTRLTPREVILAELPPEDKSNPPAAVQRQSEVKLIPTRREKTRPVARRRSFQPRGRKASSR